MLYAHYNSPTIETFARTPEPTVTALLEQLPLIARLRQMPMAQLTHIVASVAGVKNSNPTDWLTGLARERKETRPRWPLAIQRDIRLALELGVMSQECYDVVGE